MVYQPDSSGSTFGWTFYPAIMLVILGFLQIFTGLFGILGNEVYVATEEYPLQLDSVTWGWIHLVVGALAMVVGLGLFAGRTWARTLGVIIAVVERTGDLRVAAAVPPMGIRHPRGEPARDLGAHRPRW